MSRTLLCAVCQKPIRQGDLCSDCLTEYGGQLNEPWLLAAVEGEHDRRNADRTDDRHIFDPSDQALSARSGNAERMTMGDLLDSMVGALDVQLTPGQWEHCAEELDRFEVAAQRLKEQGVPGFDLTNPHRSLEFLAVTLNLLVGYLNEYHPETLRFADLRQQTKLFNAVRQAWGIERVSPSGYKYALRQGLQKLRKLEVGSNLSSD